LTLKVGGNTIRSDTSARIWVTGGDTMCQWNSPQ